MVGTWLAMVTLSPELRGVQLGLGVWGVTVGIRDWSSSIPVIPVGPRKPFRVL